MTVALMPMAQWFLDENAPIHKALPHAAAVFHTHMPYASALTRLEDPRIKEIGQTEVILMDAIAYDDNCSWPITASPHWV